MPDGGIQLQKLSVSGVGKVSAPLPPGKALSDVQAGQQILFVCQVKKVDPVTGIKLALFGPSHTKAATAQISPDGTMNGNLADFPNRIPITIISGFVPFSVGDILENSRTGETVVCRWSDIHHNGNVVWSSSANANVVYSGRDWNVVGHIDL